LRNVRVRRYSVTRRLLLTLTLAAAMVVLPVAASWAQDNGKPKAQAEPTIKANDPTNRFDVDASGTDVKYVLEALARRSGANIVVSPEVTGEVTIHLKQATIDDILDYLSKVQGFKWEKQGVTYLVAPFDKFAKPSESDVTPAVPQSRILVWICKHVKASDLVATIKGLFDDLKVTEGPSAVKPVLGEGSTSGGGGLGGSSTSGTSGGSSTQSAQDPSRIVLFGPPDQIARAQEVLENIDKPKPQVSIQVAITEIRVTAASEIGIDWTFSDLVLQESTPSGGIRFGKYNKQPLTFTGTISALIDNGKANLLAQPNLSVLDGDSAYILIGDRILYPKLVGYTQFGTPIYDKEEERVGIYLQVAPLVADEENIVLKLYPQVSLVTGYLKTQAGDYPQISTREAKTTVSVKSGATIAIGGLLRENDIKDASKIPLLGDLPIIGGFFRHTKTTREKTEIVIFLTPKIVGA
jgi:type II secretory pathway component GspD/PulD (secretin)